MTTNEQKSRRKGRLSDDLMKAELTELAARRATVVEILRQVLADPSQASLYFKQWPASVSETNPELSGAWGALEHFCNDSDLRKKDPEYEKVLLRQLSEILADLQNLSGIG